VISQFIDSISHHDCQIAQYEDINLNNILPDNGNIEILMGIPGIGFTIGSSILAEIGNIR
jgi:hypothetical protein